jgi:hypothetical protein
MWKIIGTDNLNRESVADILIEDGLKSHAEAKEKCDAMNAESGIMNGPAVSGTWYTVVAHDYRLSRGMEDLV